MKRLSRTPDNAPLPIKVIQFGEGNFLRAFVDWMVNVLNEKTDFNGGVAIVQPLEQGLVPMLNDQEGLYHLLRQGVENGATIDEATLISCISKSVNPFSETASYFQLAEGQEVKLIFSNTTEAGIVFQEEVLPDAGKLAITFPGKLTQLLKHRFDHFGGSPDKGIAIIPCELIEQNGTKLKDCVNKYIDQWGLGDAFKTWVNESCAFANTLVDRIVPGYPKDEIEAIKERIGFDDKLVVKSEAFHLFVIEAPDFVQELFPAHKHGLNVKYVKDITPYRTQKVRILNGAHTSMVPIGLLYGLETVSETINNEKTGKLVREIIFDEIVSTIQIPGEDPKDFAEQVISRFQNPFIRHELMSISLNSVSKFKVRVLPTILDYQKTKGILPNGLVFSLACLIQLYLDDAFSLKDDQANLDFFNSLNGEEASVLIKKVLSNTQFWDKDLTSVPGMTELVTSHFQAITTEQMNEVLVNI